MQDSGHAEQLRAELLAVNDKELTDVVPDIPRTEKDLKSCHKEL